MRSGSIKKRTRAKAGAGHARRFNLVSWRIAGASLAAAAAIVVVVAIARPDLRFSLAAFVPAGMQSPQFHMGTIVLERDPAGCRRMRFDNDTGAILPDASPCEKSRGVDDESEDVRSRMDAVSRSFYSH